MSENTIVRHGKPCQETVAKYALINIQRRVAARHQQPTQHSPASTLLLTESMRVQREPSSSLMPRLQESGARFAFWSNAFIAGTLVLAAVATASDTQSIVERPFEYQRKNDANAELIKTLPHIPHP
tara:strand:+ start:2160 stop:2537 length:378 start_codon:yes stop_codon:yes gene_type:complete